MIHSTAVIHPKAHLDPTVTVGPYAVIEEHVTVGPNCRIGPHVHLCGTTFIGAGNAFHTGCVIGDAPQDLKYHGEATRLRIGDNNIFREHVTIHCANNLSEETTIGSNNFFMANSHVGHNTVVGNHVMLANGTLLAGHVHVADRAIISGNCLVHQFVRVGTLALMQGGAAISKDLPPFTIAHRVNELCGLNVVGLRRNGYSSEDRLELRRVYLQMFRSGRNLREALADCLKSASRAPSRLFLDFISSSKRGICTHNGRSRGEENSSENL